MKKLLFCFWFASLASPLHAQLRKGDMMAELSSYFYAGKINAAIPGAPEFYFSTDIFQGLGYMFSDHAMAGANYRFNHSRRYYSEYGKSNTFVLGFSPFFRYYYFEKNGFLPFAYVNSQLEQVRTEYEIESADFQSNKYMRFWLTAGLGVDYFLSKNIALEAIAGTRVYENDQVFGWNGKLFVKMGFRTFIGEKGNVPDGLMDRYLRKGNFVASGFLDFAMRDNDRFYRDGVFSIKTKPQASDFALFPSLTYFTSDRASVSINPGFELGRDGNTSTQAVSLGFGYSRYLPLAERLFFVPSMDVRSRYYWSSSYSTEATVIFPIIRVDTVRTKSDQVSFRASTDMSVQFFTKGKTILKSGFRLSLMNVYPEKINQSKFLSGQQFIYAGMDQFISTNLYFGVYLGHYKFRSKLVEGGQFVQLPYGQRNGQLILNCSLGYFFFSRGNG